MRAWCAMLIDSIEFKRLKDFHFFSVRPSASSVQFSLFGSSRVHPSIARLVIVVAITTGLAAMMEIVHFIVNSFLVCAVVIIETIQYGGGGE